MSASLDWSEIDVLRVRVQQVGAFGTREEECQGIVDG